MSLKKEIVFWVLLLLFAWTPIGCSKAGEHYKNAVNYEATADFKNALEQINLALKLEPENEKFLKFKKNIQSFMKKQQR